MPKSSFNPLATKLGYLVISWSHLEDAADMLFSTLMLWNEPVDEIHETVRHQLDFRDKLNLIKTLAFARDPDSDWFNRVEKLVNVIDNELRVERNALVHGRWNVDLDGTVKRHRRSRPVVAYKQSRRRHLALPLPEPITLDRISEVTGKILDCCVELANLDDEFIDGAGALQIGFYQQ